MLNSEKVVKEDRSFYEELREALAWLVFAGCTVWLPETLRGRLNFSPLLASVGGPWVGAMLLVLIGVRPPRGRWRSSFLITAACAFIYLAGRFFGFPK